MIDVVADIVDMVKTNTKGFCNDNIKNISKYWPGGYYLVLNRKPIVPGDRPLMATNYKYNCHKFLSFNATEGAGFKKYGIPYLSNYPDQSDNVAVRPVFFSDYV